ncbi:MAG: hypothetical protein WKF66_13320 [Pedobacter sp.]
MRSPLTNMLLKIFAAGFYRAHSGMLVFLFGTLISYCFFINTLGNVPIWAFAEWNLVITLSLVTNPFILLLFFLVCFGYAMKSIQYVTAQLALKQNEFLYYGSTSLTKFQQYISWFYVQLNILVPLWIYALFATIIGISYKHYMIPSLIILYLSILTALSTLTYLRVVNGLLDINKQTLLIRLIKKWNKPFFYLYTFYVFSKQKLAYLITKTASWMFMIGMFSLFSDQRNNTMIPITIILFVVTAHSVLIYNEHRFTETSLYFSHNLPYSRNRLFIGFSANYLVLMLPELLWFMTNYHLIVLMGVVCFGLSVILLFRSLMYLLGLDIKKFMFYVFLLFNVFFLAIVYHVVWYVIPINLAIAYLIFTRNYLNQSIKY